jgi:FPC/CPF motif-containing protein YcgG
LEPEMLMEKIAAFNGGDSGSLEKLASNEIVTSSSQDILRRSIIEHIGQSDFPCVGAKSALAQGGLTILSVGPISATSDDLRIHDALLRLGSADDAGAQSFRSLAVIFAGPQDLNEPDFEAALWRRLGALMAEDRRRGYSYAPGFSDDPADPHFALSFGGQAMFAVGLHPNASRKARRLSFPAIMFNPHDQFKRLREEQNYERMREVILTRDADLDGEPNPMVARHGEISEARQYSGRAVGSDWRCPLSPRGVK